MHENTLDPLELLEYRPTIGRRATYEAFELHPLGNGDIKVINASYGADKRDHAHVVHVVSGIPSDCTCPAWQFHEGACKHMVRVALSPAVIDAAGASADQRDEPVLTDGGETAITDGSCPFGDPICGGISGLFFGELSCWNCYRLAPPHARDIHQAWVEGQRASDRRPAMAGEVA